MFRIEGQAFQHCDGLTRRTFLQAGALGVGGLLLPDFLRMQEAQAAAGNDAAQRKTAVILFWMSGGPGHHETWDPKPNAPEIYRGPFRAIDTNVAGIQFSEMLPEEAKIADKLAIIRTVQHSSGDHTKGNHWMLTGHEGPAFNAPDNRLQRNPSMGSITSMLRGPNTPGMPPYAAAPHLRGGTDNIFHYTAFIGGEHKPFIANSDPNSPKFAVRDLIPARGLTFERLKNRKAFLETFDTFRTGSAQMLAQRDGVYQRAFEMLTGPQVRAAYDINAEPDKLRDKYGRHTFGQSALLARRLVEAGVTFVTVNVVPWDHHGTSNRYRTKEGADLLIPPTDRAIAALVNDLVDRGLFDRTLVVAMGEFGRTPKMNTAAGRDHWGHTFSVLMANGRMKMGQTIGESDSKGAYPATEAYRPADVVATVYHHLGIDPATALKDRLGKIVYVTPGGIPIQPLIG